MIALGRTCLVVVFSAEAASRKLLVFGCLACLLQCILGHDKSPGHITHKGEE